ncbi:MAG: dockerin type I repeat-containing protein [Bacteroidaceae bacterium]|nr:dockerin type I repeat-containing protein [Bacteroidaceae bacterium]
MKKFLLSLTLVLLGAMGSSVYAKYTLGSQLSAADLKDGDTVIFEYVASVLFPDRYLTLDPQKKTGMLGVAGQLSEDHVWVLEEGPADLRYEEGKTFYLKNLTTGLYVVADGGFSQPFSTTSDIDKAANIFFPSCGEDIPFSNCVAWTPNGNELKEGESGDKIVNWGYNGDNGTYPDPNWKVTDKSVGLFYSRDANGWSYMTCYFGTISFTGLQMCNQWNVYHADYLNDKLGDLDDLINQYSTFSPVGGTTPGYYQQDAADRYNEAMEKAVVMLLTSGSDEEIDAMIAELREAKLACEAASIPLTAGYYYIVSAYDEFLNVQGVEKAAYYDPATGKAAWRTFDAQDGDFIFYIEPAEEENLFYLQHFFSDTYAKQIEAWTGSSATTPMALGKDYTQRFTMETEGMWLWTCPSQSYPGNSNGKSPFGGKGKGETVSGKLAAWGRVSVEADKSYIFDEHTNLWYIRPVSDEVMQTMEPIKAQKAITQQLEELIQEGREAYSKLFSYTVDKEGALITTAGGGINEDPIEGNQLTFQTIRRQGVAGSDDYKFLIDDIDSTYMQGSGYIDIDLSKTPVKSVAFTYNTRCASGLLGNENQHTWGMQERPNKVNIYATNDTGDDAKWTFVTSTEMGALELPATFVTNLGGEFNRLRYEVITNATGGNYFTVSEFQLYKTIEDQETSQYYTTDGLKDAADALMATINEMVPVVEANTATKENIETLNAAIAAVKELYADTTELAALIADCEVLLDGVVIGDEMGQLSDESLETALQTAIDDARNNAFTSPISVAAVKEATTAVKEARAAFMAGIKSFEVGKWYFITNLDIDRVGEDGAEDAFCGGSAIYLRDKYNTTTSVKWGLFDKSSMALNADNNPKAMWRFVPIEGTEDYAIQNMYTGYYLGDFAGENINLPVSQEPVPYNVAYSGNAQFRLYPHTAKNKDNLALWPEGYEADVVCHVIDGASAWTFVEIDPEEQEAISISDFAFNLIDVMAVPYNISGIADYNTDVHTYAIRKITQQDFDGDLATTIELYEKDSFKAGEPCIIVLGSTDPDIETEPFDLVIPFPTDVVDHTVPMVANGIVGGLHNMKCAGGTAISTGKQFIAVGESGSGFDDQTGVIDLATYKGEVEGVETALTLTVFGMSALPEPTLVGDVDGDGEVNTADVVAVYAFIIDGSGVTKEAADVNGDGDVNSADVVAIYTAIVGPEGSASPRFKAQMLDILNGKK